VTSSPWPEHDGEPEVPLPGGDVTEGVVRVGGTVRRPVGPHSPLVHAVLAHLEGVGFDGAPRFLGIDGRGREVLTFVEGEVAGRPAPPRFADDQRAASVARLLRDYDDAVLSMPMPAVPPRVEPPGIPPSLAGPPTLIGHLDVTPENVVFRDERAFALIDFDLARPATRGEEVANLLLWWAPLQPPEDRPVAVRDADVVTRAALLVDAYGLAPTDRDQVVRLQLRQAERSWHLMRWRADHVGGGWRRMWDEGVGERIRRRGAWLEQHADALATAVTAS
jgi:hypothetical protein